MCKALGRSEIFDLQNFFNDFMAGLTNQPYMAYSTHDTPLPRPQKALPSGTHKGREQQGMQAPIWPWKILNSGCQNFEKY